MTVSSTATLQPQLQRPASWWRWLWCCCCVAGAVPTHSCCSPLVAVVVELLLLHGVRCNARV